MHYAQGPRPRLFGHRGASGEIPENTIEAFEAALRAGADRLELDVHLSADGEVMVFHDHDLERTTNARGPIAARSREEIQNLDAGYHFESPHGDKPFRGKGLRVPTFAEVLAQFPETPLNVEIKENDPKLVQAVSDLFDRYGAKERVLLAAESHSLMKKIRAMIPGAITGMSLEEVLEFMGSGGNPGYAPQGFALQVPTEISGLPIITRHFVDIAHALGVEVHAWVINEEAEMQSLVQLGVDGIMTDFPAKAAKALGRL